jgi:hypothetical protein
MRQAQNRRVTTGDFRMKTERRKKQRLYEPVSIIVRGSADCGQAYQFKATARNIGPGGLCAFAPRIMAVGEKVTLFVRLSLAGSNPSQSPAIAARAVVVRVDEECEESSTFAVSFLRYRFV